MISFKEYFLEAYIHNKPFPVGPPKEEEGRYTYNFKVGDTKYVCNFTKLEDVAVFDKVYEFSFGNIDENGKFNLKLLKSLNISNVKRIFATIEEIFLDFFPKENADGVYFTATPTEPTRVRFYQFLLRHLQKEHKYRYLNKGGMSILFNPRIDGKKVDEFEELIGDSDTVLPICYKWRGDTESGYFYYGEYIIIEICRADGEYPNIGQFNYNYHKEYVLTIKRVVNTVDTEAENVVADAFDKFFDCIIQNNYKHDIVIIDINEDDPYFNFYEKIVDTAIDEGRDIKRDNEDDRVIWYMTY